MCRSRFSSSFSNVVRNCRLAKRWRNATSLCQALSCAARCSLAQAARGFYKPALIALSQTANRNLAICSCSSFLHSHVLGTGTVQFYEYAMHTSKSCLVVLAIGHQWQVISASLFTLCLRLQVLCLLAGALPAAQHGHLPFQSHWCLSQGPGCCQRCRLSLPACHHDDGRLCHSQVHPWVVWVYD